MLSIEYIHDPKHFAALRSDWNALLRESAANRMFLTWEWLYTWWCHLRESRRLAIVVIRSGAELVGILPVALERSWPRDLWPLPRLESLGSGSVGSDYLDLVAKRGWEDRVLDVVATELGRLGAMLRMPQIDARSALATRLAAKLGDAGWGVARFGAQSCPFIRLAGYTWDSYLAGLGSEHRYNFRRRLKNLEKLPAFSFGRVVSDEERREVVATLARLNHERWKTRGGSQAFHERPLVAFHEELTRRALEQGWLRLYALRLEGQVAAALYGLLYDGVFSFYQSGFDPRHARHSVGLVTMGLAIRAAFEEGATVYDMLHGDEPYKFLWCRETREVVHLELYPPNHLGRIGGVAAAAFRKARHRAGRALPPRAREALLTAWSLARGRDLYAPPTR